MLNSLLRRFDLLFVPEKLRTTSYNLRVSRLLVAIHLFILVMVGLVLLIAISEGMPDGVRVDLIGGLVVISMIAFHFTQNLSISGNLIACAFILGITPAIQKTGGIFSDNLIWLLTAPLLSLLFCEKIWSLLWFAVIEGLVIYFRYGHLQFDGNEMLINLRPDDFFLSHLLFFLIAVGIVFIFKFGQEEIIKNLRENQLLLEEQKQSLALKNDELKKLTEALRHSNSELETFAYAASHDLKEPLRMIGMYTSLLRRRIGPTLAEENVQFMGFITDGISRMERLLDDLLNYSRIGRSGDDTRPVKLNDTLFMVKNNLSARIQETHAEIVADDLPTILARPTEMMQLFQNIIANALKFRKKDLAPHIEITWLLDRDLAIFGFKDNGIGIREADQERVFSIFERLHAKTEYEGSGIGLATCKKIILSLDGKIWLRSEEGIGTTFFFSIPREKVVEQFSNEAKKQVAAA